MNVAVVAARIFPVLPDSAPGSPLLSSLTWALEGRIKVGEMRKSPYGDSLLALVKCFALGDVNSREGKGWTSALPKSLSSLHSQATAVFCSPSFKTKAKYVRFYPVHFIQSIKLFFSFICCSEFEATGNQVFPQAPVGQRVTAGQSQGLNFTPQALHRNFTFFNCCVCFPCEELGSSCSSVHGVRAAGGAPLYRCSLLSNVGFQQ